MAPWAGDNEVEEYLKVKADKCLAAVKGVSWKENIEKTVVKVYVDAKVKTSIVELETEFVDKEMASE